MCRDNEIINICKAMVTLALGLAPLMVVEIKFKLTYIFAIVLYSIVNGNQFPCLKRYEIYVVELPNANNK